MRSQFFLDFALFKKNLRERIRENFLQCLNKCLENYRRGVTSIFEHFFCFSIIHAELSLALFGHPYYYGSSYPLQWVDHSLIYIIMHHHTRAYVQSSYHTRHFLAYSNRNFSSLHFQTIKHRCYRFPRSATNGARFRRNIWSNIAT